MQNAFLLITIALLIAVSIYCFLIKYRAKHSLPFHDTNNELKQVLNKFSLIPTNKNKEKIKKYEELLSKIENLIRSLTKNSDDYDKKYMKIKFNSDDELPLNKTIKIPSMTIFVRPVFMKITNTIHKLS